MTNIKESVVSTTAVERAMGKRDFEILFQDSPDYFVVKNAKMMCEGGLVRFVCYYQDDKFKENAWYPLCNIQRIKSY